MSIRSKTKHVTVCGVQFSGATAAEAKDRGEAAITTLTREIEEGPSIYRVGNMTAIVWPIVDGWSWRVLNDQMRDGTLLPSCSMSGTRSEAAIDVVFAMIQRQWTHEVADDAAYVQAGFACLGHADLAQAESKIKGALYTMSWQRRYRAVRPACASDQVAFDITCRTESIAEALKHAALAAAAAAAETAARKAPAVQSEAA